MATRSGQAFRTLLRFSPSVRITNVPKYSYSVLKEIRVANSVHLKSLPVASNITLQKRFYGDGRDDESLEEQTMTVLKLFDKVDPDKVSIDAHLVNDLGLDSLDVVEVIMAFEDEFGIEINDEEAEKVFTVRQAAELIQKKLDQGQ